MKRNKNLLAEMARSNVSEIDLSNLIGKCRGSVHRKLTGKSEFTFSEAIKIRDKYFPEMSLEYLFR